VSKRREPSDPKSPAPSTGNDFTEGPPARKGAASRKARPSGKKWSYYREKRVLKILLENPPREGGVT